MGLLYCKTLKVIAIDNVLAVVVVIFVYFEKKLH